MESLEITIKSASNLKDASTIGTMEPYVIVALSSNPKSVQKTDLALFGGTNPKWRSKPMKFAVNEETCKNQNVLLVFKIMAKKSFDGDKEVGNVVLLVKELFGPQVNEKQLSCTVSTPSGRPKGTLHFVYKFFKNAKSNVKTVYEPNVASVYNASPNAIGSVTRSYGTTNLYPSIMAIESDTSSCYGTNLYPHSSSPHPQLQGVTVLNPPPMPSPPPQNLQTEGYYYAPPHLYPSIMAIESDNSSCYGTNPYPHSSSPHPQLQGVTILNPPPSPPPQNLQTEGYYYYAPPQQGYDQPPNLHYQQPPVGYYYPPPLQGHSTPQPQKGPYDNYHQNANYPYAPGPSNRSASGSQAVQVREVAGKKPKSKKGGWLAAVGTGAAGLVGTMLLGPDVGSSLVEMVTSGLDGAADYGGMHQSAVAARGYYNFNNVLNDHFGSIGSAIG